MGCLMVAETIGSMGGGEVVGIGEGKKWWIKKIKLVVSRDMMWKMIIR
jgi:hypothetical protein